jgi:transposase
MRTINPNPDNGSLADLNEGMRCSPDSQTFVRCHGLKLLLTGYPKEEVARIEFVTLRTVQNWINLWNAGSVDALKTGRRRGRSSKIPTHLHGDLCNMLRHPELSQETHWTMRKLHGYLRDHLSLELGYSTLTRFFRQQGFRLKVPRSWPLEQDEAAREAFRKQLVVWLSDPALEVWFCDETGITGDPRPRRRWAHRKDRIRVPYLGTHIRENIVGAVHPATGQFISLILPGVDSEVFQLFLDELALQTTGRSVLLILDNASWHKTTSLNWHHIKPEYLPTYSPDLNPIEELWLYIKEHYFRNWIAKTHDELQDRMVWAIQQLLAKPEIVKSVTACEKTS